MPVGVQSNFYILMPQSFLDNQRLYTMMDQVCHMGVPQIMYPDLFYSRFSDMIFHGVLYCFSYIAAGKAAKAEEAAKPKVLTGAEYIKSKQADIASASDIDQIAIATAIYLYTANQHDEESGILTIHHTDHSAWHAELNEHL